MAGNGDKVVEKMVIGVRRTEPAHKRCHYRWWKRDIDPGIYGGDVSCSPNVDPERDSYELEVFAEADRRALPILGICRGAQLINVHAGSTLFGDLLQHRKLTSNNGTLLPHKQVSMGVQWHPEYLPQRTHHGHRSNR